MQKWLNALERKLYRYNIPPIMKYIVFAMGGVFVLDLFMGMATAYTARMTWLVVPTQSSMIWLLLSLYFYYMIGTALENRWGTRRFLIYYVIGAVANVAGAFLAHLFTGYGYGTNEYLYFSLFLAFAALYPDVQFMLFFFLPVKAKWLAAVDMAYFLMAIVFGGTSIRLAAVASLVNVALFFGQDIYQTGRRLYFQWQRRRQFRG